VSISFDAASKVSIPWAMDKLGCIWSDRLSITEKLLVKTAAFLPASFTMDQLKAAYPLEYMRDNLKGEMRDVLEIPGLIESTGPDSYKFCSSIVPKVFRKMMIESHQTELAAAVKNALK